MVPKNSIGIILRFTGVLIMLMAFIILPASYPWYYEILLFNVGLLLTFIPKFSRFKKLFN